MQRSNVADPSYYHKVVDCQWGCPAHTNVPEYIRLIAQGRFDDAYMLNRESNVFPGILGRTCDRPCEPACRRTRVDGKPVAICRLKRVAADNKGDISARLPKAPATKNGKKVALIGAGPASLTVANDLMPLGYEVTIFEKFDRPGRADAGQHPVVPAAARGARRGDRLDRRHGGGRPLQHAGRQPRRAARREAVRRRVRRQRRAQGQGTGDSRAPRHRPDLHRHRVARVDPLRPRRAASASGC